MNIRQELYDFFSGQKVIIVPIGQKIVKKSLQIYLYVTTKNGIV